MTGREWLRAIARRAMTERGFEPDFPPDVVREANALHEPQGLPGGAVDDLRRLDWVSIDNDDSRDLDQLSVAETLDGSVCLRVAVPTSTPCPAGARSTRARTNTTSVTRRPRSS
jgi:exoribonuclease-2